MVGSAEGLAIGSIAVIPVDASLYLIAMKDSSITTLVAASSELSHPNGTTLIEFKELGRSSVWMG